MDRLGIIAEIVILKMAMEGGYMLQREAYLLTVYFPPTKLNMADLLVVGVQNFIIALLPTIRLLYQVLLVVLMPLMGNW